MGDLERQIGDLLEDGVLTDDDAEAIRDFGRFLEVAVRRTSDGKLLVPAEWMPYATGEGPAPEPRA